MFSQKPELYLGEILESKWIAYEYICPFRKSVFMTNI